MSVTDFQKNAVDHVPFPLDANGRGQSASLDYPRLKTGRFEAVYFRPEEGGDTPEERASYVAQRIRYARTIKTWRDQPFDGNLWIADPASTDSQAAGIPTDPAEWGRAAGEFVALLTSAGARPRVAKLNLEQTAKGYPPWKAAVALPKWSKIRATSLDGTVRLYNAQTGGVTGNTRPAFPPSGPVVDGTIVWAAASPEPYRYAGGWAWNEKAAVAFYAALELAGLADQQVMVQPMSSQEDFNLGAWMGRRARCSPQCYGPEPYVDTTDPGREISLVSANRYARAYYGLVPDRRRVHPTIGAYGQGWFYVPKLVAAREINPFGFSVYRHDGFYDADYTAYAQLAIP